MIHLMSRHLKLPLLPMDCEEDSLYDHPPARDVLTLADLQDLHTRRHGCNIHSNDLPSIYWGLDNGFALKVQQKRLGALGGRSSAYIKDVSHGIGPILQF